MTRALLDERAGFVCFEMFRAERHRLIKAHMFADASRLSVIDKEAFINLGAGCMSMPVSERALGDAAR